MKNRSAVVASIAALLTVASTGCGKQGFNVVESSVEAQSPGNFNIAPKVDVLVFEDDTGSRAEIHDRLMGQIPGFLTKLDSLNWNYRLAVVPLTKHSGQVSSSITQVLASKQDPNWGSQWVPPYPGAQMSDSDMLPATHFRKPDTFAPFVSYVDNSLGAFEPGFETIRQTLRFRINEGGLNFLRKDALLAVIVMGNGNDTSLVNMCRRSSDGLFMDCESSGAMTSTCSPTWSQFQNVYDFSYFYRQTDGNYPNGHNGCGTRASSMDYYVNELKQTKKQDLMRVYAAVAKDGSGPLCGGYAKWGYRYLDLAGQFSGKVYDICRDEISTILTDVSSNLQAQRVYFKTRLLFLATEPNPNTIHVFRNGAGGKVEIPHSEVNGWVFRGKVSNEVAVIFESPSGEIIPMGNGSGWAIELRGSARLVGDETATITSKPAGAEDSSG